MSSYTKLPLTVVCVKWGKRYPPVYVNRLYHAVAKNLTIPHEFLCLTDDPAGVECETARLDAMLTGWWHKVTLFRRDPYGITGRILFLDLDVVIVGSLDDLVLYPKFGGTPVAVMDTPAPFAIPRDFMSHAYASCSFALDAGSLPHVWENFNFDKVRNDHYGDQDWITAQAPGAAIYPKDWVVSYKLNARERVPDGARVIALHGEPKQSDLQPDHYLHRLWCQYDEVAA